VLAKPSIRLLLALASASLLIAAGLSPAAAEADAGPAWSATLTSEPTNLVPSSSPWAPYNQYVLSATNVGSGSSSGPITMSFTLSPGVNVSSAEAYPGGVSCPAAAETVTCTINDAIPPSEDILALISVDTGSLAEGSTVSSELTISGGGAPEAQVSTSTTVSEAFAPFDFLPGANGLRGSLTDEDGSPATQAASHPGNLTVHLGFPSRPANVDFGATNITAVEGGPRDVRAFLPPGVVVNPLSSPIRCPEAQMQQDACPPESAVGVVDLEANAGFGYADFQSPLFNLVPPPGVAAALSFDAAGVGIYPHILGGVRAGDYVLAAISNDILSRFSNPFLGVRTQLWGNPSDPVHDFNRGECDFETPTPTCPVDPQPTPLLSLPSACRDSLPLEGEVDSWGHPGVFHKRDTLFTDSAGNPTGVEGCDNPELKFNPSLEARPTTDIADSPSGLDVDLHIPQREEFGTLATPHLRQAEVTLPEGLVINPAGANGLEGCSSSEIGIDAASGIANGNPAACPNASRIGSVEVDTPLIDHPLGGSVFIAAPHDNPFGSLLAIYIDVEDPQTGTIVKLAGHVIPDPGTGRLTTVFDNGPQLPFEDFELSFFGGTAAPLRTPATCGTYSTASQMTPWSAPASGPPATPSDTYAITKSPVGGSCAATLPSAPSFDAGSVSLIAGRYTPFVLNLRRNDGTQQFSTITMTPPPGLLGKLAGTPYCPEAALAAAAAKSGNAEKASPSCPAASQVGVADIGAGAGPAPYYVQGRAYLAGPYKGAPLSLAIVTPAAAGPYDLGTVVVRSALQVDPETTRITAVSDPIPQILQGIPLDVRSIELKLDKPEFTLNPTSCDPFTLTGQLTSTLGQAAPLQNPFQVAECARLGFRPKLTLRLKGGTRRSDHPALRAVLTMPSGGANIAKASVALPHSEFLDQGHIRTICTRVQFAASACPKASIYGKAKAITPLLDAPLSGPVYLRSSDNPLPDLVADLNGQIHVVLAGRIDSVNGGIRNSFEAVPDAPVSKFVLEMQGGKKGLLVNSRNLCKSVNKANVLFDAHNGKTADSRPVLKNDCRKAKKHNKRRGHRRATR
jgi:hypothetical protein